MTYHPLAKVVLSQKLDGLIYSAAATGKVLQDWVEIHCFAYNKSGRQVKPRCVPFKPHIVIIYLHSSLSVGVVVVSVGAALFLFQQLAGINAVVYYSTSVFRSAGIQSDVAASALVGASNVFGLFSLLCSH